MTGLLAARWFDDEMSEEVTAALLLGVLAPDVIDKPLGARGVLPAYHTVGHSLLTAAGLAALARTAGRSDGLLRPFVAGYLVHIAGDLPLTLDRWDEPEFFLWPLLRPRNDVERPLEEYVTDYATSPWFAFELLLVALVVVTHERWSSRGQND